MDLLHAESESPHAVENLVGSLDHLNGVPRSLWASTYARMAAMSWAMLVCDPRLSA